MCCLTSWPPWLIIRVSGIHGVYLMRLKKVLFFTLGVVGVLAAVFAVRKFRR